MPGIDETLTFHPLRIAVLTVSDSRTEDTDTSGALLASRLPVRLLTGEASEEQRVALYSDLPSEPPVAGSREAPW